MSIEYRACQSCSIRKELNISNFPFRNDTKKFRNKCKECRAEEDRNKYADKNKYITKLKKEKNDLSSKGFKRCTKCRGIMTFDKFNAHPHGYCGLNSKCKTCQAEDKKPSCKEDKDRWQKTARLKKYGIASKDFNTMMTEQDGRCKICSIEITEKSASIDHCHINGNVRGLLCTRCNTGLGMFKDNIEFLTRAISYLQ